MTLKETKKEVSSQLGLGNSVSVYYERKGKRKNYRIFKDHSALSEMGLFFVAYFKSNKNTKFNRLQIEKLNKEVKRQIKHTVLNKKVK